MSREPLRDIHGRQYGETVKACSVRVCSGEMLGMVEYRGKWNHDVFTAFAKDISKGHYLNRIIFSAYSYLNSEEDETVLCVHFSDTFEPGYMWGQEERP